MSILCENRSFNGGGGKIIYKWRIFNCHLWLPEANRCSKNWDMVFECVSNFRRKSCAKKWWLQKWDIDINTQHYSTRICLVVLLWGYQHSVTLFIGKIYEVEIVTKHLPSGKHTKLWKITIEIVNFPKKKKGDCP